MLQPEFVSAPLHPLVRAMYVKQEIGREKDMHNVLVIETCVEESAQSQGTSQSALWSAFLSDLDIIAAQAAHSVKADSFDRIDIRYH